MVVLFESQRHHRATGPSSLAHAGRLGLQAQPIIEKALWGVSMRSPEIDAISVVSYMKIRCDLNIGKRWRANAQLRPPAIPCLIAAANPALRFGNHDFSRFDQGKSAVTGLQGQVLDSIGGNNGGHSLPADGQHHFCKQAFDSDFNHCAQQLVAP